MLHAKGEQLIVESLTHFLRIHVEDPPANFNGELVIPEGAIKHLDDLMAPAVRSSPYRELLSLLEIEWVGNFPDAELGKIILFNRDMDKIVTLKYETDDEGNIYSL